MPELFILHELNIGVLFNPSYLSHSPFSPKDNLKAIYQRARAYSALYNEDKARQDFFRAERLDPKLKPIVNQELKKLGENLRAKHVSENKNYWAHSQEKWEQKAQAKKGKKKYLQLADKKKATE